VSKKYPTKQLVKSYISNINVSIGCGLMEEFDDERIDDREVG
jgi:hypothetical protein